MAGAVDLEVDLVLPLELDLLVVDPAREIDVAVGGDERGGIEAVVLTPDLGRHLQVSVHVGARYSASHAGRTTGSRLPRAEARMPQTSRPATSKRDEEDRRRPSGSTGRARSGAHSGSVTKHPPCQSPAATRPGRAEDRSPAFLLLCFEGRHERAKSRHFRRFCRAAGRPAPPDLASVDPRLDLERGNPPPQATKKRGPARPLLPGRGNPGPRRLRRRLPRPLPQARRRARPTSSRSPACASWRRPPRS